MEKRQTERFVKSLEDASAILNEVIEKAGDNDSDAFASLQDFSDQMERVYRQAERIEADEG